MRSDYLLYAVAGICFIITGLTFALTITELERNLSVVTTVVFGFLFIALGFSQRPRSKPPVVEAIQPLPVLAPAPQPIQEVVQEVQAQPPQEPAVVEITPVAVEAPIPVTQVETKIEQAISLTDVKGIKEKRAEQLKALDINNVEDLANASANDLAAKLKISSYFTERWVQNAKELLAKNQ